MAYITPSDITNRHIKQINATVIQDYCDEANLQLEDIASQIGVLTTSIKTPVSIVVIRYLNAYINYRWAEDNLGMNNTEITQNDMYVVWYERYLNIAEKLKLEITPTVLTGVNVASPQGRSISVCKRWRTS